MNQEISKLVIYFGVTAAGAIIANLGVKLGRANKIMQNIYLHIQKQVEARADGILSTKEKALLYDDIEGLVKEAYSILKGFWPNKSK